MRSTRQTVITLLTIALICVVSPFVLESAGFVFLSMELGGVGDHFAGYSLDDAVLRMDVILAFSGFLGLFLALSLRTSWIGDRTAGIIAVTLAVASMVGMFQVIALPAAGMPSHVFRREVFEAAQVAHILSGGVMLLGFTMLRLRRWLSCRVVIGALSTLGLGFIALNFFVLADHPVPVDVIDGSHIALSIAFVLAAALLLPELRRRPLPMYVVATMIGLLPLALGQIGLAGMQDNVDQIAVNREATLQWVAFLLPLLGLSIDLVRGTAMRTRERERAYLRSVLDALPDLVFTRDLQGNYRLLNQAAAKFLGFEPSELEGTHMLESAPDPSAARRALKVGKRIIETGRRVRHAGMSTMDATGMERWMQWLNLRLDPGEGEQAQVLSVATDITRLKNTEQRLAGRLRDEKLLRRCFTRILRTPVAEFPQAMYDVLADLGQEYGADLTFTYEYDYDANLMHQRDAWQADGDAVLHGEHSLDNVAWAVDRLQSGESVVFSDPDELPDAPEVVAYARQLGVRFTLLVPVFSKDGTHWGVMGGHFAEPPEDRGQSLQRVMTALADVYTTAREHHVAEQDLYEARTAAESSARAKGEFLANMSHEIRTPLNAVIGLADILRGLDASPEQVQYLDMIQHAGSALLGIINDVLDISKIEAGQLELDPVPVDLPNLLGEVVDMMAYHAQQQGLELVYHLDPDACLRTELDAVRLKQVLINLLNNAIKFTEEGHVSLRVSLQNRGRRTWCRFKVADTGIGIPAITQRHIFDKFTQADASHTRKYGGTGLGLAICRSLVGLMGGTINLQSKVGRGTLFTVEIPLGAVDRRGQTPLPDDTLVGKHFLAVAPSAAARETLATTMQELGLVGVTLPDAIDLAAHLATRSADLVLADAQMDSVMLQEVQRQVDACDPAPPRLLLAPLGDYRDQEQLARDGWRGTLSKPVRRPQLQRELRGLLAPQTSPAVARTREQDAVALLDQTQVLLVEDNLFNQRVAAKLLDSLGCQVTVAENGQKALDALVERDYDIVLMDCQMPVMDGLEATRRIRDLEQSEERRRLPIVAMTANVLGEHREACLAAGMDDFASKPINKGTLRDVMTRWAWQPKVDEEFELTP